MNGFLVPNDFAEMNMNLLIPVLDHAAEMAALRRDIHAHPELGFEEVRTAEVVATRLSDWGIPVHRGVGRTGVVGVLRNGNGLGSIGLRADMDALPMQEENRFGHASRHAGKMHACGHDGHTAMLLAAAKHLSTHRDFDGTVYLIFQPAEEGLGGARAMIEDGLFERFPMDAVFGMHSTAAPVGTFAISPGPVMAASSEFKVVIQGKGCHAAMPQDGVDPISIACQLVQAFQSIISRNKKPVDAAVLSVTMLHAGDTTNVVPDSSELQGTVRAFSSEVTNLIEQRMRALCEGIASAHGAVVEFTFVNNYPPTVNAVNEAAFARKVLASIVGDDHVHTQEPTMAAEDFAYMLQAKPGAYCLIGNGDGDHRAAGHGVGPCTLHNPSYDFNDELIPLGATYWVKLAQEWLRRPANE